VNVTSDSYIIVDDSSHSRKYFWVITMATPPRQPRYRGCLPAFLWINILLLVSPCSFPNCEAFQSRDIQTTFPITRAATVRPCSTPRLKSPSLLRANNNSDEYLEAETPELDSKEQLSMAYTAAKYLFGGTAVLHLITARPAAMFPAADFARSTEWGAAAGFGIAAGICNILKGANRADRLASDTYKRLSIGLIGFCAIGLVAVPGEAAFVALPGNAAVVFTVGVRMLGLAVASVGWKRGVVFVEGTKTHSSAKAVLAKISKAAKGLRVQNERKALTYRNCFLLVVAGMTSNFMEFIFDLRVSLFST